MKPDIYLNVSAAVICFVMAYAIAVGDLPHNWVRVWMGLPIGLLAGYAEIVIGIVCGAFLMMKVFRELIDMKKEAGEERKL